MIRRCCARPSKASSTSRKNTSYKGALRHQGQLRRPPVGDHPRIRAGYRLCQRQRAPQGHRGGLRPQGYRLCRWASATRSCATPSSRISWPSTASRSRSWSWSMPLAGEAGRVADVALRINPDIDPKTNHCIDTGQADSKFGISYEEVLSSTPRRSARSSISI